MTKVMTPVSIQVPITDKDGKPTPSFHRWLQQLSLGTLITKTNGTLDVNSTATSTAKGVLTYFDGGGPYAWPSSSARVSFSRFLMENPDGSFVGMGGTATAGSQMFGATSPSFTHWWNFAQISGSKYLIDGDMSYSFTLDAYVNSNKIYHQGNLSFGTGLTYNAGTGVLTASGGGGASYEGFGNLLSIAGLTKVGANLTLTDGTKAHLYNWSASGVNQLQYAYKTTPTTPWDIYLRYSVFQAMGANVDFGLILRNSATGKLIIFGMFGSGSAKGLLVQQWTNATTFAATSGTNITGVDDYFPTWLRINNDGTNLKFYYSPNGVDWILNSGWSQTIAAFIGAVDGVGIGGVPQSANSAWVSNFGHTTPV